MYARVELNLCSYAMGASNNIRSLFLSICLLLVLQNGSRAVLVRAQYTNTYDVLGLATLAIVYPQLDETVVDPCYPVKLTWIECSYYYPYRVTALKLGSRKLSGELPDFSSYLTALEIM
ncbi:hypothetical protein LIER_30144 [Lithospermum erythrorhizon]|uniref:Uncharacterized protein n=1 Tax=Lithospermum erythrorhizon TaxID=34254 RepID=A0AAV3RMP0_LITER